MLSVILNPGDEALASEYETTKDILKVFRSSSPDAERDAICKILLLIWSFGAVAAGSLPGGAVGGARFDVLRLGEGRVPSKDYVGRGKVLVAEKKSVGDVR
jgi:hypothetical protein